MDKPKCWVENIISNYKPTSTFTFLIAFLTQHLGLSIFYPILGSNNPALFRVWELRTVVVFSTHKAMSKIDSVYLFIYVP